MVRGLRWQKGSDHRIDDEVGVATEGPAASVDEQLVELGGAVGPHDFAGHGNGDVVAKAASCGEVAGVVGHAFETLGCRVVGLRTDNFNFRSQRAIEALGAKKDGVIRHHWPRRDGTIRDTVMYSVLAHEWADVKHHLQFRLKRNEAN